jgi:hypothetical protein
MKTPFFVGLALFALIFALSLGAATRADSLSSGFHVLAVIPLPPHALGTVAINEAINKAYTSGGGPAGTEHVDVIDGVMFNQFDAGLGSDAEVDIRSDRYWSATVYNGGIIARDGKTNQVVANVSLGGCPIDTTYDFFYNRIWAGVQCGGGNDPVFAVDARTFQIVAGPIGTGGVMGPIIANGAAGSGRLYVTEGSRSLRVDPVTFAVTSNAFGQVMAVDTGDNRLYASTGDNVQIINGAPDPEVILTTVPLSYAPSSMGINQELNHLYLANSVGDSIEVRGGTTGRLISTFSLASLGAIPDGAMTVDNIRGRIYDLASTGSGRVLVVIEDLTTARASRANRG